MTGEAAGGVIGRVSRLSHAFCRGARANREDVKICRRRTVYFCSVVSVHVKARVYVSRSTEAR